MSDFAARAALTRMNLREIALEPSYGAAGFMSDIRSMAGVSRDDATKAHLESRAELCAAFGMNVPEQRKPFAFANGFAIIPISGSLINRYSHSWSSLTGYNFIRSQLSMALADEDVKGIIFDVNSYGGEAAGCFELAAEIRASREVKPSIAVVDSAAYSAGYALASAASKVVLTPSGGVGSVGVITMHLDMSKALEDFGLKVTLIYESEHKADGNPFEPLPAAVKKNIEASIHVAYESFVALVADNRGMDAQKVRDTKSRTYRAEEAKSLGLIDAIATPNEAVRAFSGELSGSISQQQKEDAMSVTTNEPGANKGTTGTDAAAAAAAQKAASDQAAADARTAERARVSGIMGCEEAKGRTALANHFAMNTDMTVEDAKAALTVAPKEVAAGTAGANPFKAAMDNDDHPKVGADGTTEGAESQSASADAANAILRAQAMASGSKFDPNAAA